MYCVYKNGKQNEDGKVKLQLSFRFSTLFNGCCSVLCSNRTTSHCIALNDRLNDAPFYAPKYIKWAYYKRPRCDAVSFTFFLSVLLLMFCFAFIFIFHFFCCCFFSVRLLHCCCIEHAARVVWAMQWFTLQFLHMLSLCQVTQSLKNY